MLACGISLWWCSVGGDAGSGGSGGGVAEVNNSRCARTSEHLIRVVEVRGAPGRE